jgi:hypothetical protein
MGAALIVPFQIDALAALDSQDSFENTLRAFTADAYVGIHDDSLADNRVSATADLSTSLDPEDIKRTGKGRIEIFSGKSVLRAPEPPTVVMFGLGAGMIVYFRLKRPVHRPWRRKVRFERRKMAV